MKSLINKLLTFLFHKQKEWTDLTPRERAIALEVWRANKGVKK